MDCYFISVGQTRSSRRAVCNRVDAHLIRSPAVIVAELSFDYEPCEIPEHHVSGYDMTDVYYVGVEFIADETGIYSVDLWFDEDHYPNPPYFTVQEGMPSGFLISN